MITSRTLNISRLTTLLFITLAFGTVFFLSFNSVDESDVFYHLKAGELLWQTHSFPDRDVFSSSAQGSPWVLHEWLAELAFYGIHAAFGFWGLIAFVSSLAVLVYGILWHIVRARGVSPFFALPVLLLVGYFTFGLWVPRPHVFAYVFFALLLLLLERYRWTGKRAYLWFVPFLILVWANTHASFVLGLAVLLGYAILSFAKNKFPEWHVGENKGNRFSLLIALLAGLALSFMNPATYHAHLYSITIRPVARAMNVIEWRPITAFFDQPDIRVLLLEMLFILVLAGWRFGVHERRDVFSLGLLIALTALPFSSARHIGFWALGAAPVASVVVSDVFRKTSSDGRKKLFAGIAVLTVLVFLSVGVLRVPREAIDIRKVPVRPADFMVREGIRGPFFNTYSEGGYLLWRFWPNERVFIDGRSEVFFGTPVQEFYAISKDAPNWHDIVDTKYGFNSFFVGYQPPARLKSAYPMVLRLMRENWPLVYWDDATLIFVRNIPEHASVISKYAIQYVAPWRPPENIPEEQIKPSLVEISRLLAISPDSVVLRRYAEALLKRK